ncbi:hypothetical protein, partial [Salmonella enterica]
MFKKVLGLRHCYYNVVYIAPTAADSGAN